VSNTSTILIYITLAIILALSLGVYVTTNSSTQKALTYPYGQTDTEKADAMKVAFSDPAINDSAQISDKYTANISIGGSFNNSGFLNVSGTLARVDIQTETSFVSRTFSILADISTGQELEARYPYQMKTPIVVLLPAGATWYYAIPVHPGEAPIPIYMEFQPSISYVYPAIVDQANFQKLKDGLPFQPLSYTDYPSNETVSYNGVTPVPSLWQTNITVSGTDLSPEYYFVLENPSANDLMIGLGIAQA
jgi:hypothetical protein